MKETGEELGGVEGGVTVIKIYLLNKEKVKMCLDNYIHFSGLKEDILEIVGGKE